jgi:CBS domain-containing protein
MIVKNILASKRGEVVTIEPTADVTAAIKLLAERRIGAVVILGADHRIVGILSERDIVRALCERGPTALNERVSQVMTRDVKTCTEDDTIEGLMGRMTTGKFRHMPVVEGFMSPASFRPREAVRRNRAGHKPRPTSSGQSYGLEFRQ